MHSITWITNVLCFLRRSNIYVSCNFEFSSYFWEKMCRSLHTGKRDSFSSDKCSIKRKMRKLLIECFLKNFFIDYIYTLWVKKISSFISLWSFQIWYNLLEFPVNFQHLAYKYVWIETLYLVIFKINLLLVCEEIKYFFFFIIKLKISK